MEEVNEIQPAGPQMAAYTKSLLDPFDKTINQPKLLDGKVARSSGIRLRATGEITCAGVGTTYVALFPGVSNVIAWQVDELLGPSTPQPFAGHLDTPTDRTNVKSVRTVGAALRLSLVNSADQNEGYWEAARIPTNHLDFTFEGLTSAVSMPMGGTGNVDLSNYSTYLTGKLRDIHRYQFKLNAIDNDIKFSRLVVEPPTVESLVSDQWDTIIIKIHGRVEAGAPSQLMYDCISAQEVIYKENTALARLMTSTAYVEATKSLLTRTRFNAPGIQIA